MTLDVKELSSGSEERTSVTYPGYCLPYNVTRWVIDMDSQVVSPTRSR